MMTPVAMNASQAVSVTRPKYCSSIGHDARADLRVRVRMLLRQARSAMASSSARASGSDRPSRSRPNTRSERASRGCAARPGVRESGSQICAVLGNPERSLMTPMTVAGAPFTMTARPRISRSPPYRDCQTPAPSMTTAGAPGRSSSGREVASEDRLHADRREGISRDEGPVEPLGEAILLRDDHRSVRERREIRKAVGRGPHSRRSRGTRHSTTARDRRRSRSPRRARRRRSAGRAACGRSGS